MASPDEMDRTTKSGPGTATSTPFEHDVYFSYRDADSEAVQVLASRLRERGLRILIDREIIDREIAAGTLWPDDLATAVARSRTVAVFLGSGGLGPWQSQEVEALIAEGTSRPVIPVLLPGSNQAQLPPFLSNRIWVDFRGGLDNEKAFQDLLRGIQESAPSPSSRLEEPEHSLFDRLSPRVRNAVLRADAFRRSLGAGHIHMEHLVVGLFDEGDEPTRQAFERARINRRSLVKILREANFTSPRRQLFEPSSAGSLPPLSPHSEQALNAAKGLADAEKSAVIHTAHLLRGFLLITECEVVEVFTKAGLHLEAGPPLLEVSIRPASAGDQPVDKDTLGFEPYVEAIAEFLVNEDTRPPLTLSIEGEWGSGKSSFMLQLEKALHRRCQRFGPWFWSLPNRLRAAWTGGREDRWTRLRREFQPPCCLTVRFNAWRHDKEDASGPLSPASSYDASPGSASSHAAGWATFAFFWAATAGVTGGWRCFGPWPSGECSSSSVLLYPSPLPPLGHPGARILKRSSKRWEWRQGRVRRGSHRPEERAPRETNRRTRPRRRKTLCYPSSLGWWAWVAWEPTPPA